MLPGELSQYLFLLSHPSLTHSAILVNGHSISTEKVNFLLAMNLNHNIHIHTQNVMKMGYKTISLSEEAYEILRNAKKDRESFSQVVIRLASKRSLEDFIGCISSESISKLSDALDVFRRERGRTWSESMEEMLG
jgi:predicted CopG family antitoxin